jgi:hypothetical protein
MRLKGDDQGISAEHHGIYEKLASVVSFGGDPRRST